VDYQEQHLNHMESVDHGRRRSLVGYDIIESAIEAGYPETKNLLKANGAFNRNRYDPSLRNGVSNYIQNEVHEERQREILNFSHYALGENIEEASSLEEPYVSLFDHIHDFIYFEVFTKWIYDESNPEFTEQQQIVWSIIIGIVMGIFTGKLCVQIVWNFVLKFCETNLLSRNYIFFLVSILVRCCGTFSGVRLEIYPRNFV